MLLKRKKTVGFFLFYKKLRHTKGQFISKEPSGAEDSPKKRTNEFVFFYQTAFCVVKRRLSAKSEFVRSFFGRNHKTF